MNRLTTSLFFIFFGVKIALCTSISIYAPAYKNQSITWKKKFDYITNVNEIIAHEIIDSSGYVKLYFDFKENELDELTEIIFLVADNWFALSSKKYPDKDENFLMQRGMGLLIKVSEPYLSKDSKIIIKDLHGGALI